MNARFDSAVWSGVERRLADVEAFIPDAPPWMRSDSLVSRGVRAGTTFRRPVARPVSHRRPLVLVLVVVATLLALVTTLLLVGAPREFVDRRDEPFGPWGIHRSSDAGESAAVLPDGRVLIASGTWKGMGNYIDPGVDVWDPVHGRLATGAAAVGRIYSAATLLLDGRVLVTGGFGGPYAYESSALASAELWDPMTGAFTSTGSMAEPRVSHTATLLRDGRVIVIGGTGPHGPIDSAEIWDPWTSAFRPAGHFPGFNRRLTATLLPSGDVLALGSGPGQIWRVATETFTPAAALLSSVGLTTTATPLLDGRVLVITAQADDPSDPSSPPAAFISPDGLTATEAGSLLRPRMRFATTLLPDGRVLVTGGVETWEGAPMASVEVFDPVDGSFRQAAPLARAVDNHMALLLPDGRVLIVFDVNGPDGQAEPFTYDPGAPRTTE